MAAVHLDANADERLRELREAQARLRALIDNEPECVKLVDREGRLLEMNAAGLRMIEADRAEAVLGQCVYGIVAPEHVEAFRRLTERVCGGERGTLEFEIVGLKGTRRWLETHAVPFSAGEGETRLLAVTRDITERRRAEQALREARQRFEAFMDNLPASAWIRDARFRYTFVNRMYASTWGGALASVVGRTPDEIFPSAVAAYFRATDEDVRRAGAPVQFVDGQPSGRWLKVKFPVPDGEGGVGVGGIAVDITEVSRLEEALRQSESRFRSFMDNVPAVAWIKDHQLRYTYVNPSYELVYRRSAKDVLGRDDFDLHPEERARLFREEDERIRGSGETVRRLRELPYDDGQPGRWLVVKFPLADAAGDTGVAGIAFDITARVNAEEKARRYAEEVHSLVGRLVQAQEAERRRVADELHDLIGQNLTALGIDLQALKQRLELRGDTVSGPRLDAMAALLEATIGAIRGVMTDLRPVALEEFGLVPALRWYATQFSKRTGIRVTTKAPRREMRLPPPTELALFRIVQEALTNAAKHSGCGAVEVKIQYGKNVRLAVEDDGAGFKEPALARAEPRGGFGLTTMRERAEAQGGSLRVECLERGTRIVVEMPIPGHAD